MTDTLSNCTASHFVMKDFLDVLTFVHARDADLNDDPRYTAFMMAHFGFFIVNMMNAFYLIFFEGFGTRVLWFNRASQFSLAAVLSQLYSCYTSIRRYNVKNEYGHDAIIGTLAGIAGFFFINMSYLHLHYRNGANRIWKGVVFWILLCLFVVLMTLVNWDAVHFTLFRILIGSTALSNIYILYVARRDLLSEMFSNLVVSDAVLARIWISSMALLGISFACAATQIPAYTYPGTGIIYAVCTINSVLTARMDFPQGTRNGGNNRTGILNVPKLGSRQYTT